MLSEVYKCNIGTVQVIFKHDFIKFCARNVVFLLCNVLLNTSQYYSLYIYINMNILFNVFQQVWLYIWLYMMIVINDGSSF